MKLFSAICLIGVVALTIMYILTLCGNYNFLSYELGVIVGGFAMILGFSVND